MNPTFRSILLLFGWILATTSVAQGIVFEEGSWQDALKKAKKQKKIIFLHLDKNDCGGCTEVASAAFNSPLMREKFALNFISFRTDGATGIGKELSEKLEIDCTPSSIFLDTDEHPLARICGSTSMDRAYLLKAEEAQTKHRNNPLLPLVTAYANGDRSATLMQTYIQRRREAGLSTTALLDEYVQQLPADSLRSATVLRFIFEQGPVVGSRADSVFRLNYTRRDSLYRAVGWNKAVELNNLITNNSLKKAINEKDSRLAYRTAIFRQQTYTNDYKAGRANYDWVLLRYYKGVRDTLQYLNRASRYFDEQFMTAKVDSIQNLDNLQNQRIMRGTMPEPAKTNPPVGMPTGGFMLNPNTQRYVGALNNAAWEFYGMTTDSVFLTKALSWSKRTLDYREDPSSMDTYAHLLYRLARKQEAIDWQEKAVKKEQERNSPLVGALQEALKKMKAGTL